MYFDYKNVKIVFIPFFNFDKYYRLVLGSWDNSLTFWVNAIDMRVDKSRVKRPSKALFSRPL